MSEQQAIPKIFEISIEKEDELDKIAEEIWDDTDTTGESVRAVLALDVPENEKQYVLYLISARIGTLKYMQMVENPLAQFLNVFSN